MEQSGSDLVTLQKLADEVGVHVRTLQRYVGDPVDPMPTHQVCLGGKHRGRRLVSRTEFREWVLRRFPAARATPLRMSSDLDRRVAAAVRSMRGG